MEKMFTPKFVAVILAAYIAIVLSDPISGQDEEAIRSIRGFLLQHNPNSKRLKLWLNNTDNPCLWRGIECGYFHEEKEIRVRKLNLSDSCLSGPLPPALANLTALAHLILANNSFTGRILRNLRGLFDYSLEILDLSSNKISGEIPSLLFSVCSRLKILNLSRNRITGRLPDELQNCKNLSRLLLGRNNLTGAISKGLLFNCGNLTEVDLEYNRLEGTIPRIHVSCSSLTSLRLAKNLLTGQLPKELASLSKLQKLELGKNRFTGTIPPEFGSLKNLQLLSIEKNHLQGSIPPSLGRMVSLENLFLHKNKLNATIPKELSSLRSLQILDLNRNGITGTIPPDIGKIRALRLLFIASNALTGTIPPEIGNLTNLLGLDLSKNRLSGSIPATISNLQSLLWFSAWGNHLQGHLPAEIVNCGSLLWLNVAYNQLSGPIPRNIGLIGAGADTTFAQNRRASPVLPKSVGECWAMTKWFPEEYPLIDDTFETVRCNDFWFHILQGTIRAPSCVNKPNNHHAPAYIQLSGNRLTGTIPESLANYTRLGALLLANNHLSGHIPEAITGLSGLSVLNLSHNNLGDAIPESLGLLTCLRRLDLSRNNLQGVIPGTLKKLSSLSRFNVSFNRNLRGPLPEGQFRDFYPQSYFGDPHLLHESAQQDGMPTNNTYSNTTKVSGSKPLTGWATEGIFIAAAAVVIIALGTFFLCHARNPGSSLFKWGSSKHTGRLERNFSFRPAQGVFTYANIAKATDNFSDSRCIGRGGQGIVYKAELEGGLHVAVKKLCHEDPQADVEFLAEMQTLGGLSHPNLVPLLGCCLRGNQRILVYKLIENGSLEEWLHDPTRVLEWPRRLKIALGCSLALRFLHHECPSVIIHRDVKANNVLLDSDFNPFLTDFGLARNQNKDMSHVSTAVVGTLGYVPPEYSYSWKATTKGDVYSFGVILMQLATGLSAVGVDDELESGLVVWVRTMVGNGISGRIFDPRVMESDTWNVESAVQVLMLACQCTGDSAHLRPSMMEVASTLQEINDCLYPHPLPLPRMK